MIGQINNIAEIWWAWMWPMFWQVGVLVALIWLVDLVIRAKVWPQVRYALWLLVLVKLVLPPTFSLSTSVTSQLPPLMEGVIKQQEGVKEIATVSYMGEDPTAFEPSFDRTVGPIVVPRESKSSDAVELSVVTSAGVLTAEAEGERLSWRVYVVGAWLVGAVILAVLLMARFRQLRQAHRGRKGRADVPEWLSELLVDTAKRLNLRRTPEVALSGRVTSPAVFGVLRPVLLLPEENIAGFSRKDFEHVLLHELAHLKRGDLWVHSIYMVLQIVYWFNPLLWIVRRQLQHLRELCCDATVAGILREKTVDYRETVVETARRLLDRPIGPGMGLLGLFEDSSRLLVRLKWLEKKTWKYRALRIVTIFTVVALMLACVLPMAKARHVATASEPDEKTDVKVDVEPDRKSTESKVANPAVTEPSGHAGRISGVVVNAVTGEPIDGAYVGVGDFGDSGGSNYARHRSQGFHDKTKTDEKGRFELDGLVFTDDHSYLKYHPLVVTHPDFVRHDEKIVILSSEPVPDVKISLRPAAKINVTVVDADGSPLEGYWLLRLEALDGRRFIPPGQDRHLSAFASSVWLKRPDLRKNWGISEGFSFTELDTGEYSIEAIQLHFIIKTPFLDRPTEIWAPSITYHGAIAKLKMEAGQTKEVQIKPANHQTSVAIKIPEDPYDKREMPPFIWISRRPAFLLDTTKVYHPEDSRLGRLTKSAYFHSTASPGDVFTIKNLPAGSYSVFAVYYGKVPSKAIFKTETLLSENYPDFIGPAVYVSAAKLEVSRGREITVELPPIKIDGAATVKVGTLERGRVKFEAKEYSVRELCELLTAKTESNPSFIADSSIEIEKLKIGEGEMSIWDLLETICLQKGWRVDEGEEKTLILRPGVKTDVEVEGEKKSNSFAQEQILGSTDKLVSKDLRIIPVIKPHITIEHKRRVDTVLFLPNGKALISESFGEGVKVSDTQSGNLLRSFPRGYAVNSMAMSHDGATLAIGTNRGTAEIWSIETLNLEKRFQVTEWSIYAVALSPDSTMLASCAADGTVQLWDIKNSKLLKSLGKKGAYRMSSMSFSPDSKVLATLSRDGRADMWDVVNGRLVGTLPTEADSWGSCSITFCPDANTVAIATPGLVLFWRPQNNNQVQRIEIPDSINPWKTLNRIEPMSRPVFVGMVVLSRDCKKAASVIEDGSIVIWDVQTRTVQLKLVGSRIPDLLGGGIEIMAFSPDKSLFASGNRNGNVQLWKLADRIKSKKPMNMKRQLDGTVEIPAGWTAFPGLFRPGDKTDVDLTLSQGREGSVSGTVRFHGTGAPAAGVVVRTISKWFDTVQARTDQQGSYTLAGIRPEAVFHISAEDEQKKLFMTDMPAVVLKPGEAKTGVDLKLYQGRKGSISGKVVGRRVFYQKPERLTRNIVPENFERRQDTPLSGVKIVLKSNTGVFKETITDETGRYRFEGLRADDYMVRAELPQGAAFDRDNYPSLSRYFKLESEPRTDVDLHFRLDGISIAGRVTDTNGNPIGGAKVVAEFYLQGEDEGMPVIKKFGSPVMMLSATDGRYRLDGLWPVTFSETATYLIHGKLYRWYEMRVQAKGYSPAEVLVPPVTEHLVGETSRLMEDYKGLYGERDLSSAEVALPKSRGNAVTGIDFVLQKAAVITGRVLDTQGNVVPGPRPKAWIRMVFADSRDDKKKAPLLQTPGRTGLDWIALDEAGRFKFDGVGAGSYFFEIRTRIDPYDTQRARNETLVVKAGDVIKDLEVIKDLDVIVESAADRGKISGRVLDARSGKPIKAFSAKVTRVDSSGEGTPALGRTTIDKSQEGAFLIEDISTGTATLEVSAPGYAREKVQVKVVSGQTTDRTFNLEQGGKLQVYVTLNGKGQMAWVVSARPAGEGPDAEISTQMGKDGRYELTGLKEAEYLVRAPVPLSTGIRGRATVQINNRARVKIEPGKETRLDFELRDNAGIRGAFTGPDKDLSWRILVFDDSAAVRADSVSEVKQAHALIWKLEQGKHYEIRCLPPGTYRVVGRCCKKEQGWTAVMEKSKTVTVGAGQVAEVDFVFP